MGRKKLTIKRLESVKARQNKYSKRKVGILKKANEISVLCDVDLALIMFSPSGKPTLYVGHNKELLSVVDRLSRIPVEDREQRRAYTVKLLKKIYADTDVDLINISLTKNDYLKLKEDYLRELQEKIAEKTKILNEWKNPEIVDDLNTIQIMENHLYRALENIRAEKRELNIPEQQEEEEEQEQGVQEPQRELNVEQQQEQIGQASQVHLENENRPI